MINESAELIRKKKVSKERLGYKYIIVDEYQDISRQRYNLIKEISSLCNAKIVAVGDDWQSIYAFSGSILPLFTHFCEEFGYGQELKITRTYRNAQELINIAGSFVQRNTEQIQKSLISNKSIENPVIIQTYSDKINKKHEESPKGGVYHFLGEAVNLAVQSILHQNVKQGRRGVASILLIGRYGFDARNLCNSDDFNYDEKSKSIYSVKYGRKVKLSFLTAHSSKGLSADNVIIINAKDDIFGFPSQIEDDPVLRLVVTHDDSYNYAEERRLFYVALTRTKNRVFIITPETRPSEFIKELLSDKSLYPNVLLNGSLTLNTSKKIKHRCPICGYPMQRRMNKNYGLELWMCMNDQEICGFMTNDTRGGDLSIKKCDWCKDG
jgi:DNA helicase-4